LKRRGDVASGNPPGGLPDPLVAVPRHDRPGRRLDLALGVLLGALVGVAVVAAFVFLGSEGTVDAPRISGVDTGKPGAANPAPAPPRPLPTVRVIGGAPPPSGPAQLHFKRGEEVRFRIVSDAPTAIEIPGYGIEETVESGQVVSFEAKRVGQFPLVAAGGEIGLASLFVSRR
jgi:hypothetical protein